MLRFSAVKHTLRVAARFLLTVLGALVVFGLLGLVYRYVTGYAPEGATIVLGPSLVSSLKATAIPAVSVAILLALFDILRVTERPAVPLITVTVLGAAFALATILLLDSDARAESPSPPTVAEQRVIRYDQVTLYVARQSGLQLGPGVIYDPRSRPGFISFGEAVLMPESGELRIPRSARSFPLGRPQNAYPSMVAPPPGLRPILEEVRTLNEILGRGGSSSVALTLSVILYLVSCWTLIRLSRWPAFNAVLAVGAARALLWTFSAIENGLLRELAVAVLTSERLWLAQMLVVLGYSAVMILVGVLLPPLRDWKRETEQ